MTSNPDKYLNILHLDMDAFFAAIEERDRPNLKGKPLIIGGQSNNGIVTTANYEARKYGVHSAMPIFMAKSLCPNGVYLKTDIKKYRKVSGQIFEILYSITNKVEKLSVDEAYMDISDLEDNYLTIVKKIKTRIYRELGLTLSAGVSYNKFLAKLASDMEKPNGLTVIRREEIPELLFDLPISKVYGIGPKTRKKLESIGVFKVKDMYQLSRSFMFENFGKNGLEIYRRIRGIDSRELDLNRERKSIGIERTFDKPTRDKRELVDYLRNYILKLSEELIENKIKARSLTVKIKDENFINHTRSRTLDEDIFAFEDLFPLAKELFEEFEIVSKIRLLGVTAANLSPLNERQLSFLDE